MTIYDLIEHLAHAITDQEDHQQHLVQYLLDSLDDNRDFLRSRYCKRREGPIPNRELGEVDYIICGLTKPFNINCAYFQDEIDEAEVGLSMQVIWGRQEELEDKVGYNFECGYNIIIMANTSSKYT